MDQEAADKSSIICHLCMSAASHSFPHDHGSCIAYRGLASLEDNAVNPSESRRWLAYGQQPWISVLGSGFDREYGGDDDQRVPPAWTGGRDWSDHAHRQDCHLGKGHPTLARTAMDRLRVLQRPQ